MARSTSPSGPRNSKRKTAVAENKEKAHSSSSRPKSGFTPPGTAKVDVFRLSEDQEKRVADIVGMRRADAPEFFATLDFAIVGQAQEVLDAESTVESTRKQLKVLRDSCEDLTRDLGSLSGQALHMIFEKLPGGGEEYEKILAILGDLECAVHAARTTAQKYPHRQGKPTRRMLAESVRDAMRAHTQLPPTDYDEGPFARILQVLLYPNEENSRHDIGRLLKEPVDHSRKDV